MSDRETWYVLEDGSVVSPAEVSTNDKGALVHKSGVAVAMRGDAHSSRGVDPKNPPARPDRQKIPGKGKKEVPTEPPLLEEARDMKPAAQQGGYQTRDVKAD
jgi:hypothetical protein